MIPFSADHRFGIDPTRPLAQPTGDQGHAAPGAPAANIASPHPDDHAGGNEAAMAVVVVLGLAVLLSQVSFSGTIKVGG